jgi:hypothetical protein
VILVEFPVAKAEYEADLVMELVKDHAEDSAIAFAQGARAALLWMTKNTRSPSSILRRNQEAD